MHICLVVLFAVFYSGCFFQNISPAAKMQDSIRGLNDEARWGRTDLAIGRVAPAYKQRFSASRIPWGKQIQIAGSEVISITKDPKDQAICEVLIEWYSLQNMSLRKSKVRQVWKPTSDSYELVSEKIIDGDAGIFATEESDKEELDS